MSGSDRTGVEPRHVKDTEELYVHAVGARASVFMA